MKIHTLTIEHRHGRQVSAHVTRAEADAALAAYVRERAEEIIALQGELDDMDDAEAVAEFYRLVDDESAEIDECDLALPDLAPLTTALQAIRARVNGEWDNPALVAVGPLGSISDDVLHIIAGVLSPAPFAIQSVDSPDLFWSNADGWGDKASATRFTTEERAVLNLPVDGIWVEV